LDTLWNLRTIPITPPRGFEKLRGQVDRTGEDCLGGRLRPPENIEHALRGENSAANKRQ